MMQVCMESLDAVCSIEVNPVRSFSFELNRAQLWTYSQLSLLDSVEITLVQEYGLTYKILDKFDALEHEK